MRLTPSKGLALVFAGVGLAHFLKPDLFDLVVPRSLPGPARAYTVGSAIVEFVLAAGLLHRSTRQVAGYAAGAYLVVVFPANLQMAFDGGMPGQSGLLGNATVAWARLPLQIPLVWSALKVGNGSFA